MLDRLIAQAITRSEKSILLLGPRQVGKSTLILSLNPDLVINLAAEDQYLAYSKDASLLKRTVLARKPKTVFIDEIQRIPSLLNTTQALLDASPKQLRFFLTGSSARKLKRGGANLLPGRIRQFVLDPLVVHEIGADFDLQRALQVGTLPGIYFDRTEGKEVLDTYCNTYLREEIQIEAAVKDIGPYARFLDAAAVMNGQWINYSKFSSDTEIPKENIRRYFQLLEDTLLAFRLPSYQATRVRRVSQRDKLFFFDPGVRNTLLGIHHQPLDPLQSGISFEHFVVTQIIYFLRAVGKKQQFYSYRTESGAEVDLIIDTPTCVFAIECKSGRSVRESDFSGIRAFKKACRKKCMGLIVYTGENQQWFGDQERAVPITEFFSKTLPDLN